MADMVMYDMQKLVKEAESRLHIMPVSRAVAEAVVAIVRDMRRQEAEQQAMFNETR